MEKENKELAHCSSEKLEIDLSSYWAEREIGKECRKPPIKTISVTKSPDVKIKNRIGDFFKRYNIIAYGFTDGSLNIDVIFLLNGYACLCRAESIKNNTKDITISLVSEQRPKELLLQLADAEIEAEKRREGIYYFQYMFNFQIIVLQELPKKEKFWLEALMEN